MNPTGLAVVLAGSSLLSSSLDQLEIELVKSKSKHKSNKAADK